MLRTVAPQPTLWEALLPESCLALPPVLAEVDELLDDPRFFEPFRPFFDPIVGRPSVPMETYLRMMFLRFRYLCRCPHRWRYAEDRTMPRTDWLRWRHGFAVCNARHSPRRFGFRALRGTPSGRQGAGSVQGRRWLVPCGQVLVL